MGALHCIEHNDLKAQVPGNISTGPVLRLHQGKTPWVSEDGKV